MQGDRESIEKIVTEQQLLVKDCGYQNSDEMVRDRIIFATISPHIREKLLSQGAELTLEKAIDITRSHELANQQPKTIGSARVHDKVHAVCRKPYRQEKPQKAVRPKEQDTTQCMKCKKFNHFTRVCKSKPPAQSGSHRKTVHTVRENTDVY